MSREQRDALRRALALDADNHLLRAMLADLLAGAGEREEALGCWEALLAAGALDRDVAMRAAKMALEEEDLELAERFVARARSLGADTTPLDEPLRAARRARGVLQLVPATGADPDELEPAAVGGRLPAGRVARFADIGGMSDLKKQIERRIILPFRNPSLWERYRRKAGGGVLLYGPPGCGKTLLARATAGECGLPFFVIRIEDILGPYLGQSEARLHAAFDEARRSRPCVLFIDEIDTLGFARGRMTGSATRSLVDQLLQELDGAQEDNQGVLVLAATNAPWDLDDALLRPGRFDRLLFVPPPDAEARASILDVHLRERPCQGLNVQELARKAHRFSGADLAELVDRAFDLVIDEALRSGAEPPATMAHFNDALADMRPSTLPWLQRAQNYVEFANRDGRWSDVETWLSSGDRKGR